MGLLTAVVPAGCPWRANWSPWSRARSCRRGPESPYYLLGQAQSARGEVGMTWARDLPGFPGKSRAELTLCGSACGPLGLSPGAVSWGFAEGHGAGLGPSPLPTGCLGYGCSIPDISPCLPGRSLAGVEKLRNWSPSPTGCTPALAEPVPRLVPARGPRGRRQFCLRGWVWGVSVAAPPCCGPWGWH